MSSAIYYTFHYIYIIIITIVPNKIVIENRSAI